VLSVPQTRSIVPDFDPILPPKRRRASFQTTNLRGDLQEARSLFIIPAEPDLPPGEMERAMSEVEFDQMIDAVRREIALPPVEGALAALRVVDGTKAVDRDRPARRRVTSAIRIRRVGEGQKRYR